LPAGFLAGFGQGLEEIVPVNVIQEDILTPVSTTHDVVHRTPAYSMRSLRGMVYLAQNQPPNSNRKRRNIWVDPYLFPYLRLPGRDVGRQLRGDVRVNQVSGRRTRTPHSRELRDREPKPVAAAVAFISTADATGVGDSTNMKRRRSTRSHSRQRSTGGAPL
jgi:hypothetical protein